MYRKMALAAVIVDEEKTPVRQYWLLVIQKIKKGVGIVFDFIMIR